MTLTTCKFKIEGLDCWDYELLVSNPSGNNVKPTVEMVRNQVLADMNDYGDKYADTHFGTIDIVDEEGRRASMIVNRGHIHHFLFSRALRTGLSSVQRTMYTI